MTLRITLLVLVTGLFALVWTFDRSAPRPFNPALVNSRQSEAVLLAQDTMRRASTPWGAEIPMDDLWMFGGCEMPLPTGLAPGEYRVVSNRGLVREISVTADDLRCYHQRETRVPPRGAYESQDRYQRWYFIRVEPLADLVPRLAEEPSPAPAVAERGRHEHRPAIAVRDDQWRAQQTAGKILLRAGGKLSRRLGNLASGENPGTLYRLSGVIHQARGLNRQWSLMTEEIGHSLRRMKWAARLATEEAPSQRL